MDTAGFVDVEGTHLYYEVAGSGPPVVLMHGGWLNLRQWDDQIEALSSTFTVIRYDARGYGRSLTWVEQRQGWKNVVNGNFEDPKKGRWHWDPDTHPGPTRQPD